MKRLLLTGSQAVPHFIGSWESHDHSLCDAVVDFFEANKRRQSPGTMTSGTNFEGKRSTDLTVNPGDLEMAGFEPLMKYVLGLFECFQDYGAQWPFLKSEMGDLDVGPFNIQKYSVGDHFSRVHAERTNLSTAHRALAWMTYLSDVEEGGVTSFPHFDIEVPPEKGKTMIWPSDWTHAHQGRPVKAGVKYIVTGWLHYPHDE